MQSRFKEVQITIDAYLDDFGAGAIIDETGAYRYSLWRRWDHSKPKVVFIMLNPSTADHIVDDPTIRRCISFSKSWGFGSLEVVNLFAYRATDPRELIATEEPVGKLNDEYIKNAIMDASLTILAWGTKGIIRDRNSEVLRIISDNDLYCLEITKEGHPKHPLYVGNGTRPINYRIPE